MSKTAATDTNQQQQQQGEAPHGQASEHGHTGEGAASALAHLISQGEKHRRQSADVDEPPRGSGHP